MFYTGIEKSNLAHPRGNLLNILISRNVLGDETFIQIIMYNFSTCFFFFSVCSNWTYVLDSIFFYSLLIDSVKLLKMSVSIYHLIRTTCFQIPQHYLFHKISLYGM